MFCSVVIKRVIVSFGGVREPFVMQDLSGSSCRWLILLPCLPQRVSLHTLRVAYGPGLTQCIRDISKVSKGSNRNAVLDFGVACRNLSSLDYPSLRDIFGLLYKLICIICTEQMVDLQFENDVDVRVFLFHEPEGSRSDLQYQANADRREWPNIHHITSRICSLESETGESLIRAFLQIRKETSKPLSSYEVLRLPGGLTLTDQSQDVRQAGARIGQHLSVAVGGTFDHLHAGHKVLLTMAALLSQTTSMSGSNQTPCLTIGITGDELLKNKKFREHLETWDQRQASVKAFLDGFLQIETPSHILKSTKTDAPDGHNGREVEENFESGLKIRYTEIFDPFGPTITDPALTALALSAETRRGGKAVNEERQKKGWPPLEIFEVDVLDSEENPDRSSPEDETFPNKLSSTEIRSRFDKRMSLG